MIEKNFQAQVDNSRSPRRMLQGRGLIMTLCHCDISDIIGLFLGPVQKILSTQFILQGYLWLPN